jgi:hypothetical protein
MDPAAQQFIQTQTELLQNLSNIVVNMQAQVNNPPQQQAHLNKHWEFMSHHPPVFTHAADPLEAEDWLKTVLKMLTITQCNDREKVLYAAGRLQGQPPLGRMHMSLLTPPQTLSHGTSSPPTSGAITYQLAS